MLLTMVVSKNMENFMLLLMIWMIMASKMIMMTTAMMMRVMKMITKY